MKIKLFGKELFEFSKSTSDALLLQSSNSMRESKYLPDFYTMREGSNQSLDAAIWQAVPGTNGWIQTSSGSGEIKLAEKSLKKKFELTPKKVYELKFLNKENFKINTDAKYVDEQLQTCRYQKSGLTA